MSDFRLEVMHPGKCFCASLHLPLADPFCGNSPDCVETASAADWAHAIAAYAAKADIVLSIDHVLPPTTVPRILMSNSIAYMQEFSAVLASGWKCIIAATASAADRIRAVNPGARVETIHYGFDPEWLRTVRRLRPPDWSAPVRIMRLPHRPDPRKGQEEAIRGLTRAQNRVILEISWFSEHGSAEARRSLEDIAAELDVSAGIEFVPWTTGEDYWRRLENSHGILQLGTFEETFCISVFETVLAGRTAVIGRQPAIKEVLGEHPLLIEVADSKDWPAALERVASGERSVPVAQNIEFEQRFALARMVDAYANEIRWAVAAS